MDVPRMDRSLGELFSDLSQQTSELIHQEMRLAKAELSEKAAGIGRHAMLIGAGLEPWVAAVIAAVAMGVLAFVLAQSGMSALKKTTIAPVETMHSLKETTQWLKNETR